MFDRRIFVGGLTGTILLPITVRGQTSASGKPDPTAVDGDYVKQVMALGSLSLLLSRMADDKIAVPKIKEFAAFEVEEQNTLVDVLASLQHPDEVRREIRVPSEPEAEARLLPAGRKEVEKMRGAEAGAAFTREYFVFQMAAHQQLLRLHEEYLKSGNNPRYIAVCKLADLMVREHLQVLADIKTSVGTGSTAPPAPL
jgi:putative membrane protein